MTLAIVLAILNMPSYVQFLLRRMHYYITGE